MNKEFYIKTGRCWLVFYTTHYSSLNLPLYTAVYVAVSSGSHIGFITPQTIWWHQRDFLGLGYRRSDSYGHTWQLLKR